MADILQITLPDGTTYNIKDNNALPLTGGQVTGPVTFGSSVSIDDLTAGNIVVTGNTSFVQGIPWSTITGAPTTISGYGITDAVTDVAYNSSTYNITKTINGTTTNVLQMPCIAGTGTSSLIAGDLANNTASGESSFAAGGGFSNSGTMKYQVASGKYSFTAGSGNTASGDSTSAFGINNTVSGKFSIAVGSSNTAASYAGFAGGAQSNITSSAHYGIAFGYQTEVSGSGAVAFGAMTKAAGFGSMAIGQNTIASALCSFVSGLYNIEDTGTASDNPFNIESAKKYAFIIGNGSSANARSNALTIDWYGNINANNILASASIDSNGLISFKNSSGTSLFTLQLPLYNGGVS